MVGSTAHPRAHRQTRDTGPSLRIEPELTAVPPFICKKVRRDFEIRPLLGITRLWPREGGLQNTKRPTLTLRGPADTGRLSEGQKVKQGRLCRHFHVFFGKFPPLRGLFTNLRESIKEAKSINQPDAKPGIKKPRP